MLAMYRKCHRMWWRMPWLHFVHAASLPRTSDSSPFLDRIPDSWNFDTANFLKWFSWFGYSFGNGAPETHTHTTIYKLLCITVNKSFSIRFVFFMRHLVDNFSSASTAATSHINCIFFLFLQTQLVELSNPNEYSIWKRIQNFWQFKNSKCASCWNEMSQWKAFQFNQFNWYIFRWLFGYFSSFIYLHGRPFCLLQFL